MQHRHQALERLIYIYIFTILKPTYTYIYSYNCQLFVAQLASQVVGAFSMEQQAWKSFFLYSVQSAFFKALCLKCGTGKTPVSQRLQNNEKMKYKIFK